MADLPPFPVKRFLAPRFWGTWAWLGLLRLLTLAPYPWVLRIGRGIGTLMKILMSKRRYIAATNLRLCFPELSEHERARLLGQHFQSAGQGLMEMAMCWWKPMDTLHRLSRLEGLEHLQAALAQNKGAILLSGHFTTLEIGATLLNTYIPITAMYREHKNPLLETVVLRARLAHARALTVKEIRRGDVRGMLRSLKHNLPVWYAPDQNYGPEHSVFVPFFGVPAATVTTTSRLARMSGAPVVPFFQERLADSSGYRLVLEPALEDFPSHDVERDCRRINALIETWIRRAPEHYLWLHRRFKTRPPGEPDLYRLKTK